MVVLVLMFLRFGGALVVLAALIGAGLGLAMFRTAPSRRARRDAGDLMIWAAVFGACGAFLMMMSFADVHA